MKSTPEYQALLKSLSDHGYQNFFGVHRELKYLAKTLTPDEQPMAAVRGYVDGKTMLCALTPRRIIFLDLGLVYSVRSSDVPLKMVNGISHTSGIALCSLQVTNGADTIVINDVLIKDATRFIGAVNQALSDYDLNRNQNISHYSPADELLKYKQLLDQSVITQAQFDDLKQKILNGDQNV